jgi:hypothetical protein
MKHERQGTACGSIHSLIPPSDFKAILTIDDREDALARYCLTTATYTIEQYCHRHILRKKRSEFSLFTGDYIFPLRDYPVQKILVVYLTGLCPQPEPVDPCFYHTIPACADFEDMPYCLSLSSDLKMYRGKSALQIHYWAGYASGKAPSDLASACLELAAWNMSRYQGKKIGVTGAAKAYGEHLELSMPENVRLLLEPYRRRMI